MVKPHRIIPPLTSQDLLRFWSKVRIRGLDECWPWIAAKLPQGYGLFGLGSRTDHSAKIYRAHRIAWTIACGPIPDGLCVLHHCDNPACCNPSPAHLFLGTRLDNNTDRDRKHRWTPLRGEQQSQAKLTAEKVRALRAEYATGTIGTRPLARRYGVKRSTIVSVLKRKRWVHVK